VLRKFADVQCEACHGKGTRHSRNGSYRLVFREELCVGCHDAQNSPSFDPQKYWEKIAH
jgi:hypothetical protein